MGNLFTVDDSGKAVAVNVETGNVNAVSVNTDTITEKTAENGVTVEDVLIKDKQVYTDFINERTTDYGVTIDGVSVKDGVIYADTINEKTENNGVTIEGVIIKDSAVSTTNLVSGSISVDTITEKTLDTGVTVEGVLVKDGNVELSGITVDSLSGILKASSGVVSGSATKSDIGLGNVDDVQQMPMTYLDTDGTLAANSDQKVPSQKAVKTYADTKEPAITKKTAFNQDFETSTSNIKMNGTVSVGTSDNIPRADHVHPSDTAKVDVSEYNSKVNQDVRTTASPTFAKVTINGNIIVNTSSTTSVQQISDGAFASHLITAYVEDNPGYCPALYLRRSRGSLASPAAVLNGDLLGKVGFQGYNGSEITGTKGALHGYASGNWSTTSNPTRVVISVTNVDSTALSNRYSFEYGSFYPMTDNAISLGKSGARWSEVWAATGTIQTSDERQKENIKPLENDSKIEQLFNKLNPVSYKWKDYTDTVKGYDTDSEGNEIEVETENKHTFKRLHHGLVAQEVEQSMNELGISSEDFAGFIKDKETGEYGLRYEEFIPMLIMIVQKQQKEIDELKSKLSKK